MKTSGIAYIPILLCLISCNSKKDESEAEVESPSTTIVIERSPNSPTSTVLPRLSGEIRYSADNVTNDTQLKQITLSGSVWHIQGRYLTDGREDQSAILVLDSDSLNIIRSEGEFEKSILIE